MVNIISLLVTKHTRRTRSRDGEHPFWRERGAEYARKLFAGIKRHTTQPYRAFILTDSPELTPEGVIPIIAPHTLRQSPGWWMKMGIFKRGLFPEGEKVFYSDLDNVISGPLDPLLDLDPKPLIMMHDTPNQYEGRWGQGSTMLFRADELAELWDEYAENHRWLRREFSHWPLASDQAFIQTRVEAKTGPVQFFQEMLPDVKFLNSRWQLEQGADTTNCSFVYGCYIPKPHESKHPYYAEHWTE